MITTSYLFFFFLFVMVSKLNDLPTNLCCNSETCLPTNKWLIWIYLSALTKVLLFGPGSGTLLYNWSGGPPNDGTINDFFWFERSLSLLLISLIIPLSIFSAKKHFFLAQQRWMCSVCSGLLYNRSSDFISCNKYFNITARVTTEFFTDLTVWFTWVCHVHLDPTILAEGLVEVRKEQLFSFFISSNVPGF